MKYLVLALLMFAAGLGVMHLEYEPQSFTPVVRVRTTDGLFVTYVQRHSMKRAACSQAVDAFDEVLGETCPTCVIESSACSQKLDGIDGALARNERLPLYTVDGETFRISIVGPPEAVRSECRDMAAHMVRQGIKAAACHLPVLSPVSKG